MINRNGNHHFFFFFVVCLNTKSILKYCFHGLKFVSKYMCMIQTKHVCVHVCVYVSVLCFWKILKIFFSISLPHMPPCTPITKTFNVYKMHASTIVIVQQMRLWSSCVVLTQWVISYGCFVHIHTYIHTIAKISQTCKHMQALYFIIRTIIYVFHFDAKTFIGISSRTPLFYAF